MGTIVDLVAWDPEHPTDWALRAGRAVWLGSVAPQYLDPEPVWVRRTVLDWFCAGCTGLVVLARDTAQAYSLLMGFPGGIYAEDEHHKAHLEETLKRPWQLPPIFIGPRLQREVPRAAG